MSNSSALKGFGRRLQEIAQEEEEVIKRREGARQTDSGGRDGIKGQAVHKRNSQS
jgi:hypothetical protein